jgi:hypothetical protein
MGRASRRHRLLSAALLAAALAILLAPPLRSVAIATLVDDWRASPRFDGSAYVVSDLGVVEQDVDPTGVAAVLATFDRWRGGDATEASVVDAIEAGDFAYRLGDFEALAASYGLEGRWVETDARALPRLKVPFVAHLSDGGGRFVIVRRVALGHVYAADPTRGNVLYPLDRFTDVWTGRAFAFPVPPTVSGARR